MAGPVISRHLGILLGTILSSSILSAGVTTAAIAQVHVEGTVAAVHITTNKDAIVDVLAALEATFNVRYRTSVPLTRATSDTYAGSFGHVISRLLDGYDYVIAHHQDSIEIMVFGQHGEPFIAPVKPEPAPKGIVAQWR